MVKNATQIKSGITINVGARVKTPENIVCMKKIIFGIMLYVIGDMVNMYY